MKLLFALSIFFIAGMLNAQTLPNNMTKEEKELMKTYQPPVSSIETTTPPIGSVRTQAEWEESSGFIMAWTSFTAIQAQIIKYGQLEGKVYLFCSDSNSVKTYLTGQSVTPTSNIKYIYGAFNTIWARDYGPWAIYKNVMDSVSIVDWIYNRPRPLDDQIPVLLSNYLSIPIYSTTVSPNALTHTGGNFMTDGNGTGFSSKLVLNENSGLTAAQVDTIMRKFMGITRYPKMETLPYDQIHHIDMHIKLLDEETLLVGQYPAGIADGPQIEANLQYILNNFQTCYGKPYKVVRIIMPPAANGTYPNNGGDYRTYTNSLIINKTVLVPTYAPQYDSTALRIYREAMPGYKVYGIDCNAIIPSLGAIHCITKEIGVPEPVFISHSGIRTSLPNAANQVKAYIKTKSGVASARLFWRTDTLSAYSQINMNVTPGDTFTASIPSQPVGTKMYYYISATSVSGRTIEKPLTAPQGYYKYSYENITAVGNGSSEVRTYALQQNYPNPFNPVTTIKYSVPEGSYITLKVYDMLGKEVASLVNERKDAGDYQVNFNAGNNSSGVYYYKLISGNYTSVRSMVLVK
ncbi:hypothetical protein BH10BAC5_BH10BAC5_01370 [soil metagenome]